MEAFARDEYLTSINEHMTAGTRILVTSTGRASSRRAKFDAKTKEFIAFVVAAVNQ